MKRTKSLARRTFALVFALSVLVMLMSLVAATAASFLGYEREAERYLLSQVYSLKDSVEACGGQEAAVAAIERYPLSETRCTLVGEDGAVIYDTEVPVTELDNHADREEVVAARESGQGVTLRKSQTLGADTLYAAVPLENGGILRLSETRTSLASFLGSMYPQLVGALIVIFTLSLLATRIITRMVVKPLKSIDLSHPLENHAYEEIQPLLARVDAQARELLDQNETLRESVEMRREFTGNVSHEMKSPLQVIGGYAELMENGLIGQEDVSRVAGLIRRESESMGGLVDDILTLSKLDEREGLESCAVALEDACSEAASRLSSKAEQRRVSVVVRSEGRGVVHADGKLAGQMAYNLIDNAIAHSPEGATVLVEVSHARDSVSLRVSDAGAGIPDEYKERVFERFFRVDDSRARSTGGTGLGLAIVKHVAESCGGEVHIEDNVPCGAVFVVTLPCLPAA